MTSQHVEVYAPRCIMVTGAAGFIASHFVNLLMRENPKYKVVAFDKLTGCASLKNLEAAVRSSPLFRFVKGDLRSGDLINYVLLEENVDTVVHFAAHTHVDDSFGNSIDFTRNNVEGTHTLLECCRAYGKIRRYVHVSTDEVYGENRPGDVCAKFSERQSLVDPTNPYAATKAAAEMICRAYLHSYKLPIIVTRGNNVYGEGQFPEKLVPKFVMLAFGGKDLTLHGDGNQKRSFLHCSDVANAFSIILHKGSVGEIYNIGTDVERSVLSVAEDILRLVPDTGSKIVQVRDRLFNDRRYSIDSSKLEELGWKAEIDWERGLKQTIDWYRSLPGDHWSHLGSGRITTVLSRSSEANSEGKGERFLIFGRTGWLGGILGSLCIEKGLTFLYADCRLEQREAVEREMDRFRPTHVLNAAGVTGRPNVDWCEDHRVETLRTNVIGTLTLADVCCIRGVHVTNFATGCIFQYDEEHPIPEPGMLYSGKAFTEEDSANFHGSFYSHTKGLCEDLIKAYGNVLTLRVRMPIGEDLDWPRNFVYKIARYAKVVNIPNSMTALPELMPFALELARRERTGIFNFTNPGVISHNEVLDLYKEYCDPDFTYENFTLEEQDKILKCGRSNNELDSSKLKREFPAMLDIRSSLLKYVFEPAKRRRLETKKS